MRPMGKIEDAIATQVANIESSTGRSMAQWVEDMRAQGLDKHGQMVAWLKSERGMTHGNANLIATRARQGNAPPAGEDLLEAQYAGPKAGLRPVYNAVVAAARTLGDDVDVAVKKTGVSLRRSKQFALIEVPSAKRVVLGLNSKTLKPTDRLQPASGMCTHKVILTDAGQVDDEVRGWLATAYKSS